MADYNDYHSIHGRRIGITRSTPTKLVLDGVAQPRHWSDATTLPTYTVANAPSAADYGAGAMIYVSNGAAGSACVAFSDGSNWKRVDTLATISAS